MRTSSGLAVKVHHHQYKQQVIGVDRVFLWQPLIFVSELTMFSSVHCVHC